MVDRIVYYQGKIDDLNQAKIEEASERLFIPDPPNEILIILDNGRRKLFLRSAPRPPDPRIDLLLMLGHILFPAVAGYLATMIIVRLLN